MMPYVTFSKTTQEFLAGRKIVTRRFWKDTYVKQFQPGTLHMAVDRSTRAGEYKRIGIVRSLLLPFRQPICLMESGDLLAEGGMVDTPEAFAALVNGRVTDVPFVWFFWPVALWQPGEADNRPWQELKAAYQNAPLLELPLEQDLPITEWRLVGGVPLP